jgi:hypothetical protein
MAARTIDAARRTRRLMVDGIDLVDRCLDADDAWSWYYRHRAPDRGRV